jgi:hypothetical protein
MEQSLAIGQKHFAKSGLVARENIDALLWVMAEVQFGERTLNKQ